jgi:hypothetical protein
VWRGGLIQRSDGYSGRGIVLQNVYASDIFIQQSYNNSTHIVLQSDDALAYNRITLQSAIGGNVGILFAPMSSETWINFNTFNGCTFGLVDSGTFIKIPKLAKWLPDGNIFNNCDFEGGKNCKLLYIENTYSRVIFDHCWFEGVGMTPGTFPQTAQIRIDRPANRDTIAKTWAKAGLSIVF